MPATSPSSDLEGFPARVLPEGGQVFRLVLARDPASGEPRRPWWFSCTDDGGAGRFDLPHPRGTCHTSYRRAGAWLEIFRTTAVVDRRDVDRRRLLVATRTGAGMPLADLDASASRPFGVTAEIGAAADLTLARAWAGALDRVSWAGLSSACRHDPSHAARTIALFGRAGPRTRLAGWTARLVRLAENAQLWREIAPFGVEVASVPHDVPITPPPTVRRHEMR